MYPSQSSKTFEAPERSGPSGACTTLHSSVVGALRPFQASSLLLFALGVKTVIVLGAGPLRGPGLGGMSPAWGSAGRPGSSRTFCSPHHGRDNDFLLVADAALAPPTPRGPGAGQAGTGGARTRGFLRPLKCIPVPSRAPSVAVSTAVGETPAALAGGALKICARTYTPPDLEASTPPPLRPRPPPRPGSPRTPFGPYLPGPSWGAAARSYAPSSRASPQAAGGNSAL